MLKIITSFSINRDNQLIVDSKDYRDWCLLSMIEIDLITK